MLPRRFNPGVLKRRKDRKTTVGIFLEHELVAYNDLMTVIDGSLRVILADLKGLIVIDEQLEQ